MWTSATFRVIRHSAFMSVLLISFLLISVCALGQYSTRQVPGEVPDGYKTKYLLYTPFMPGNPSPGTEYPLLVSLHGGSAIGDDANMLMEAAHENPAYLISQNRWWNLPFIVVSPQLKLDPSFGVNYNEQNWPPDLVDEVIEHVRTLYNIDPNRIYVTGISLGAAGAWNYAVAYPDKVAALMPMGGKAPKSQACQIKDIPIWAFHGENDGFVPPRFTTDMVNAIQQCQPQGAYIPKMNLSHSMGHDVWNQLFNLTGGYDIYSWFLAFEKGNSSNKSPFVFTGVDRKVLLRPGPIYLTSEYFDSDGTITSVQWTQTGGSARTLQDVNTRFLRINDPVAGTFTFRLTVTDDDGAVSFDEVTLTILASNETRAIIGLTLTNFDGGALAGGVNGTLADDKVFDLTVIGTRVNILPSISNTARVRWSINSDNNTRKLDSYGSPFWLKSPTASGGNAGWTVTKGEYLVCATPYSNALFANEGTSLCYKIRFTDEPSGTTRYYARPGLNLSLTTSWNTKEDGTGVAPSAFTDPNQWFIVTGQRTIANPFTISGTNSRLVVSTTGELTLSNSSFTVPAFYIEGSGKLKITADITFPASATFISRTSSVTIEGENLNIPVAEYGFLTLKGSGNKTLATGNNTIVRQDLTVEAGSVLRNPSASGGNNGLVVCGNASFANVSDRPYVIRFSEGFGPQNLVIPGSHTFVNFFIDRGCTVDLIAPNGTTVNLGHSGSGGRMDIQDFGLLKLNGHGLTFTENAALNVPGGGGVMRTGAIELDNCTITINAPGTTGQLNLYPAKGKNKLRSLDVHIPASNAGLNIMDSLSITQNVKVTSGTINTNGLLSLLSTPSGTAYASPSTGNISGNVHVHRVIKPGKMYRYLSFPVKNYTVAKLQQFVPVSGAFQGRSPGYSTSPSLYEYIEPEGWMPYPRANSTNADPLKLGQGYAVYIRETLFNKRLIMTGELQMGSFNFTPLLEPNPNPADPDVGWTLCGNPYASPIQWKNDVSWGRTDIDAFVYVRDNSYASGLGRFLVWDGDDTGDLEFSGVISSGQSFWVRSLTTSPQLSITENAKLELVNPEFFRASGRSDVTSMKVTLSQGELRDNCYIKFNDTGNVRFINVRDGLKKENGYFNVSVLTADSLRVAIKTLSDTLCSQQIMLAAEPKKPGVYTISVEGNAFDKLIERVLLEDRFLKTTTELTAEDEHVFTVTNDTLSSSRFRFRLTIEKTNVDKPAVTWSDGALHSSISDDVQWMFNGADIEGANQSWFVPQSEGEYSVRTIGKNCTKLSDPFYFRITSVREAANQSVKVYPNPARSFLKVSGINGSTHYEVLSASGNVVQEGALLTMDGGEAEIQLYSLAKGFYLLRIFGKDQVVVKKFSIQ
jgi:hypothetical protein